MSSPVDQTAIAPDWMRHPLTRIAIAAAIVALAYYRWVPMPWRQPIVALVAMAWIWCETRGLSVIGFKRPDAWKATLGWALLATAASIIGVTLIVEPVLVALSGEAPDYTHYGPFVGNFPLVAAYFGKALFSAVIAEEIIFRGFLLHQLLSLPGRSRAARVAAVLLAGAIFGAAHYAQGWTGMVLTGLSGTIFGAVFLLSGRNLWAVILAHGLVDIFGLGTLYFGYY
jgi:uncharacterized protein